MALVLAAVLLIILLVLGYSGAAGWTWGAALLAAIGAAAGLGLLGGTTAVVLATLTAGLTALLSVRALRRMLLSDPLLATFRKIMPPMSQTEAEAINAGTVWWDGDLFSGAPDWSKLHRYPSAQLSGEEQSFLDNECEQLCRMVSEWQTTHHHYDMSPEAWQFIKDKGFLGMIIPKRFGGKEFSAIAHSAVVQKLSTRSSTAAVTVMVPNSLGPAELLLHYGTEEQKNHYLPRLARGLEIPCFGLTNPHAGSDAASIPDSGVVARGLWQGREIVGMRVTWEKRYITLGPIATLLGLAFRLRDPDHLIGDTEDVGITCALVPTDTPGVNIGRRHLPLNAAFQNGPNWGNDVFMPLDWIIGGPGMAGQGWRMLMESLAAGRSISLPSSNVGMSKLAVRATGAYARVRRQFKTPIGRFEGVEEALTRMGGNLYLIDAVRRVTAGAVDLGERPSVLSAIAKYHVTERGRRIVIDAMDVLGGKGICLGPGNFLGRVYQQLPVSITVEGANILTRSLIIFGQGAIRCHPFVLKEMSAARDPDLQRAGGEFDAALWGHVRFAIKNGIRALVMGLSGSHWVALPPGIAPEMRRYHQQVTRFSAAFAFLSDVSMIVLGAGLKRREKLSARLGDILALMYLVSCTLKRYEDEGRQQADAPLAHWAIWDAMFSAQNAFEGVISNYPNRAVGWLLRRVVFPLGRPYVVPSDKLGHEVARLLIESSPTRDRLTAGMFIPRDETDAVGTVEAALHAVADAELVEQKLRAAERAQQLPAWDSPDSVELALRHGIISRGEAERLTRARQLVERSIRVDDFPQDFGLWETLQTLERSSAGDRVAA